MATNFCSKLGAVAVAVGGAAAALCRAQEGDGLGALTTDPVTGEHVLTWPGVPGETYFVQHSGDLTEWAYFAVVVAGDGTAQEWRFVPPGGRHFVRAGSVDDPTEDPTQDCATEDLEIRWR